MLQNAILYETQLEEHILSVMDVLQHINPWINRKICQLFAIGNDKSVATKTTIENIKLVHAKREFGQIIRDFHESLSVSHANFGLSLFIWDCILLKYMAGKKSLQYELNLAISIIICSLENAVMECKTPTDFVNLFKENITEIQAYDYYLLYVKIHKNFSFPALKDDYENPDEMGKNIGKKKTLMNNSALKSGLNSPHMNNIGGNISGDQAMGIQPNENSNIDQNNNSAVAPPPEPGENNSEPKVLKIVKPMEIDRGGLNMPNIDDYDILDDLI